MRARSSGSRKRADLLRHGSARCAAVRRAVAQRVERLEPEQQPTGRPGDLRADRRRPRPRASATRSSMLPPLVGSWSFWVSANVTGRPIASARRRIHSISRSGAARSSPSAPAGASSNTPVPSSPSARPMPNSSSSAAKVPGTGSPSMARCAIVRDVEKPSAPASMPSRTMAAMAAMSSGVAGSLRAPRSPIT